MNLYFADKYYIDVIYFERFLFLYWEHSNNQKKLLVLKYTNLKKISAIMVDKMTFI